MSTRLPRRFALPGTRAAAGLGALGLAAGALAVGFAVSAPAVASQKPVADYHSGTDPVTFTATGVLDGNCLVSTGGNTIFIKPGDGFKFTSALAGISVGSAISGLGGGLLDNLTTSDVAGLNISGTIDKGKSDEIDFSIAGGKTTKIAGGTLAKGNHAIAWTVTSLALIPGLPIGSTSVPLSDSDLKSGAKLSWTGVIHVTDSAPQCKISVSTPDVQASVGPVHVHVKQNNVSVPGVTEPTSVPSLGNLVSGGSSSSSSGSSSTSTGSDGFKYSAPVESVPEQVVPQGTSGGGGSSGGVYTFPDSGSSGSSGSASTGHSSGKSSTASTSSSDTNSSTKPISLASDEPSTASSGSLPVVLAVIAVIALAIVAGMYARLFLLGRKGS